MIAEMNKKGWRTSRKSPPMISPKCAVNVRHLMFAAYKEIPTAANIAARRFLFFWKLAANFREHRQTSANIVG